MELAQQAKFDRLVRQLKRSVTRHRLVTYRLHLAGLAALGDEYIGLIFGTSCLAFGSILAMKWIQQLDPALVWLLFGLFQRDYLAQLDLQDRKLLGNACSAIACKWN